MNSFRSAILVGERPARGDPIVRQKKKRGATEDDLSSVDGPRAETRSRTSATTTGTGWSRKCATARFERRRA